MSALLLGLTEKQREKAEPKQSQDAKPPGTKPYVDGLLTLIPAEALVLHEVALQATTESTSTVPRAGDDEGDVDPGTATGTETSTAEEQVVVTVDDRFGLQLGFVLCILATLAAYWLTHRRKPDQGVVLSPRELSFDPRDILRAVAVAVAFIVWIILMESPMLTVVTPGWSKLTPGVLQLVAVFLAGILLASGWITARSADGDSASQ